MKACCFQQLFRPWLVSNRSWVYSRYLWARVGGQVATTQARRGPSPALQGAPGAPLQSDPPPAPSLALGLSLLTGSCLTRCSFLLRPVYAPGALASFLGTVWWENLSGLGSGRPVVRKCPSRSAPLCVDALTLRGAGHSRGRVRVRTATWFPWVIPGAKQLVAPCGSGTSSPFPKRLSHLTARFCSRPV